MKAGLVWCGILLSFASYGQIQWDLSYRGQRIPLGAIPMQYNSSFAGEAGGPRISSSFSLHTSSTSDSYHSYDLYASYDQFIPVIRSGIGITAGRSGHAAKSSHYNNYGNSGYTSYKLDDYFLSVAIAPKFSLKGKYTLSPSIDFTFRPGSYSYIDISPTSVYTISTIRDHFHKHHQLQSRIALLFNTNKFYVGYSVYLLDRDTFSVHSKDSTFPNPGKDTTYSYTGNYGFLSYLQLGYTFQRSSKSKFSFTPQLVLRITDNNANNNHHYVHFEAINLNFKYQQVIFGLNNRGWHVGWQTNKLKVMVITVFNQGYEGNLSLRYLLKNTSNRSPNLSSGY